MSNKRPFQIIDEMNVNDEVNKTATCGCCFDLVSADTVKAGGVVKMGVPAEAITKILLGEYKPMLVLLDMKEYHRLEAIPVDNKPQAAEARADRYEKALRQLREHILRCHKVLTNPNGLVMLPIIDDALTPNPTPND